MTDIAATVVAIGPITAGHARITVRAVDTDQPTSFTASETSLTRLGLGDELQVPADYFREARA